VCSSDRLIDTSRDNNGKLVIYICESRSDKMFNTNEWYRFISIYTYNKQRGYKYNKEWEFEY
jgi:hypothetical protein